MPHRIQSVKPKLRKTGASVYAEGDKPALSYDSASDIIMFTEQSWLSIVLGWLKTLGMFLVSSIAIGLILYLALTATLMFFAPVEGKFALVARGTFLGGEPSTGETVLASTSTPAPTDALSKIKSGTFGVDAPVVVSVLASPNTEINVNSTGVNVQNVQYDGASELTQGQMRLNDQVAVQCLQGACSQGEIFLLDSNLIYGEVQNVKDFE